MLNVSPGHFWIREWYFYMHNNPPVLFFNFQMQTKLQFLKLLGRNKSINTSKQVTQWVSHGKCLYMWFVYAAAKSLQLCPTLCDPIDGRPPGSPVSGILQARTLEWVAISFSNAWKWKAKSLSHARILATPWSAAYQAPSFIGFSRQKYWSGVLLPSPDIGD